ncbi:MAG: hypothetical protein ACK44A_15640 [Roseateles sp.]
MNLSRPAPAPHRYVGIGLVVALHLAGIYALSTGLIHPPARPPALTAVRPLPPDVQPPPPTEPLRAPDPRFKDMPPLMPIPQPAVDVVIAADPVISTAAPADAGVQAPGSGPARAEPAAPAQPAATPQVQSPGAVCATMPRPEVPVVNWTGEAVLRVIATVRNGRVVGSEFRLAQGSPDARTRRALQRAVDVALAGYQCQGDAMFQQDFAFRID